MESRSEKIISGSSGQYERAGLKDVREILPPSENSSFDAVRLPDSERRADAIKRRADQFRPLVGALVEALPQSLGREQWERVLEPDEFPEQPDAESDLAWIPGSAQVIAEDYAVAATALRGRLASMDVIAASLALLDLRQESAVESAQSMLSQLVEIGKELEDEAATLRQMWERYSALSVRYRRSFQRKKLAELGCAEGADDISEQISQETRAMRELYPNTLAGELKRLVNKADVRRRQERLTELRNAYSSREGVLPHLADGELYYQALAEGRQRIAESVKAIAAKAASIFGREDSETEPGQILAELTFEVFAGHAGKIVELAAAEGASADLLASVSQAIRESSSGIFKFADGSDPEILARSIDQASWPKVDGGHAVSLRSFLEGLDVEAWKTFVQNAEVRKRFGAEALEDAQRILAHQLAEAVIAARKEGKSAAELTEKLSAFPYPETVPVFLLAAYDERYRGRVWPNDGSEAAVAPIVRYVERITEAQESVLAGIPAAVDMALTIRENPHDYVTTMIEHPSAAAFRQLLLDDPEFRFEDYFVPHIERLAITSGLYIAGQREAGTAYCDFSEFHELMPDIDHWNLDERIERGTPMFSRFYRSVAKRELAGVRFVPGDAGLVGLIAGDRNEPARFVVPREDFRRFQQKHGFGNIDFEALPDEVANPIAERIAADATDIALSLAEGGGSEQAYALTYLQNQFVPLEADQVARLADIFAGGSLETKTGVLNIFKEHVQGRVKRSYAPSQAILEQLASLYGQVSGRPGEVADALRSMVPTVLGAQACLPETVGDIAPLALSIGLTAGQCGGLIEFMRGLIQLPNSFSGYHLKNLNEDNLQNLLLLAGREGAFKFASDLVARGYEFAIADVPAIVEQAADADAILEDIDQIRTIDPSYRFMSLWRSNAPAPDSPERQWVTFGGSESGVRALCILGKKEADGIVISASLRERVIDLIAESDTGWPHTVVPEDMRAEHIKTKGAFLRRFLSDVFAADAPLRAYVDFFAQPRIAGMLMKHPEWYEGMQGVARAIWGEPAPLADLAAAFKADQVVRFVVQEAQSTQRRLGFVRAFMDASGKSLAEVLPVLVETADAIDLRGLPEEAGLALWRQAPRLADAAGAEARSFLFKHAGTMVRNAPDLRFYNQLAGRYGKVATQIIKGFHECVEAGVLTLDDQDVVSEFVEHFRVVGPHIMAGYKEARQNGEARLILSELSAVAEKMGSGGMSEAERQKPYYAELLRHVYQNNAGNFGNAESISHCSDRQDQLASLAVRPAYSIDLLAVGEISLKVGADEQGVSAAVAHAGKPLAIHHEHGPSDVEAIIVEGSSGLFSKLPDDAVSKGIPEGAAISSEGILIAGIAESLATEGEELERALKELVVAYTFKSLGDPKEYFAARDEDAALAKNQDYARLCQLHSFYSDQLKEGIREVFEAGWRDAEVAGLMPKYFARAQEAHLRKEREQALASMRPDTLGMAPGFIDQIKRTLKKGKEYKDRNYTDEQVAAIVRAYEAKMASSDLDSSPSEKGRTRAVYGQIKAQREKSRRLLGLMGGEVPESGLFRLDDVDRAALRAAEADVTALEARYNEERFAALLADRCRELFRAELSEIENALAQFVSKSGGKRETLTAYVTKSKESAYARAVGGVCVATDNPDKDPERNLWDMPNYFQMVFIDPETLRCQGLVLLHQFEGEDGSKILTASLNPSETYVKSVDEAALFKGVMGSLEEFARDNGFDRIMLSTNRAIRTNRTGGIFEREMDELVASLNERYSFKEAKTFSYSPAYTMQDMDVVWKRETS